MTRNLIQIRSAMGIGPKEETFTTSEVKEFLDSFAADMGAQARAYLLDSRVKLLEQLRPYLVHKATCLGRMACSCGLEDIVKPFTPEGGAHERE